MDNNNISWINQVVTILNISGQGTDEAKRIEKIGRVCYNSEDKITDQSHKTFIENLIKRGHESVLEHGSATVLFITDRGTSHEIVRHRLASYSQESTRYVKYGEKHPLKLIVPEEAGSFKPTIKHGAETAARMYLHLIDEGAKPEQARHVLPNCMATKLVMTANYREWRHFFKMRCSPAAHPNIRHAALVLLHDMNKTVPYIFADIYQKYSRECEDAYNIYWDRRKVRG